MGISLSARGARLETHTALFTLAHTKTVWHTNLVAHHDLRNSVISLLFILGRFGLYVRCGSIYTACLLAEREIMFYILLPLMLSFILLTLSLRKL